MLQFNLSADLDQTLLRMRAFKNKDMPAAASMALNALAAMVVEAEQANERAVLDRPTPFTLKALRILKAYPGRLSARVVMMDKTASYLEPYEDGGVNKLNGPRLLKPIGTAAGASNFGTSIDMNQYGNLPRRSIAKLKARKDVFVGTVQTKRGPVTGVWQRTTDEGDKIDVIRKGKNGQPDKIVRTRKGGNNTGRPKLLIEFTDAHPIAEKNRLHWGDVAAKALDNKTTSREFGRALAQALAKRT